MTTARLLNAVTATVTGDAQNTDGRPADCTYQASIAGTGAVTATVIIEGSNEGVSGNFMTIATFSLSGTTTDSLGFVSQAKWAFVRARMTAITGTGAAVTVTMGF